MARHTLKSLPREPTWHAGFRRFERESEKGTEFHELDPGPVDAEKRARSWLAKGFVEIDRAEAKKMGKFMSFVHLLREPVGAGMDPNLKLAILAELGRLKRRNHIAVFKRVRRRIETLRDALRAQDGRTREAEIDAFEERARYRLLKQMLHEPLSKADLAAVEQLNWEYGTELIPAIDPYWGGEQDFFNIRSLTGLEQCTNLWKLQVVWQALTDLSSLGKLPRLKQVGFDYGKFNDISPLLSATSLRKLNLFEFLDDKKKLKPALETLRSRGVKISAG
jgi:hypothetical protein